LRKSPSDIDKLPSLAGTIAQGHLDLLAPGGRLVYVTCTVTRSENRDVIAAFLKSHPRRASYPGELGWAGRGSAKPTSSAGRYFREAGADGFYYAALTKQ